MPLTDPSTFKEGRYRLTTLDLPDPGAGNQLEYVIPDNTVIHVIGVYFQLLTAVTPADRWPYVCVTTVAGQTMQVCPSAALQNASKNISYYFSPGIPAVDMNAVITLVTAPLTCCMELYDLDRFCIRLGNIQLLDVISNARIRYKEWSEN